MHLKFSGRKKQVECHVSQGAHQDGPAVEHIRRASTSDPPITALDLHPAEHAAAAIELLVARLEGEQHARTRSVKATLRARRSTHGA
jgi:DNA-binding LacI/PurR family transcriptional regulator